MAFYIFVIAFFVLPWLGLASHHAAFDSASASGVYSVGPGGGARREWYDVCLDILRSCWAGFVLRILRALSVWRLLVPAGGGWATGG